ncbi:hypothetical protein ACVGWR_07040, partial [Enterobacter hormaechei]
PPPPFFFFYGAQRFYKINFFGGKVIFFYIQCSFFMEKPHLKNKIVGVRPGGARVPGAYFLEGGLTPAPPGNSNPKANTTPTPGMMKKLLALALVAPLLVSCS